MQRTFITTMPETLLDNQIIIDLPRYEVPLTKAFVRKDVTNYSKFLSEDVTLNVVTSINQIKVFVEELSVLDKELNTNINVPFATFVGLPFDKSGDAVRWARSFIRRFFPETEERLLRKALLNVPFDKTEIIWLGDSRYLPFIQRIATAPTMEDLAAAVPATSPLTREEATKMRAEIAAKKAKKES